MAKYIILTIISLVSTLSPVSIAKVNAPPAQGAPVENSASSTQAQIQIFKLWVTAYSSTPEETDDTPFITARGTEVRDGIIATNLLPFGTKVKIPTLFGDKVFIVEDRMHRRKENFLDIWMPTKAEAEKFGINYTDVIILE